VDLPVVVENDENAAAWGEFAFGSGKDVEHLVMVTVGTGVGGGIVHDGALLRGAAGVAAEIGHLRVVPGGRLCGCGNRGCWEQYASGTALVRDARAAARDDPALAAAVIELAGGDPEQITGPQITQLATQGDQFAIARVDELARWLGEGMATLAAVLDPAVFVVGGGVAEAGDLLLDRIRQHFAAQLTGRTHRPEIQVRQASLGNDAGLIGAADLARRSCPSRPGSGRRGRRSGRERRLLSANSARR
jgi:glucokinase